METLNNAHWFIFCLITLASFWIGVIFAWMDKNMPESGFHIIFGFLFNAALIISAIWNLGLILYPIL